MKNKLASIIIKILSTKLVKLLLIVLLLFLFSSAIGKSIIHNSNDFRNLIKYARNVNSLYDFFNNPIFWNLSVGITLKILIDILLGSLLLYTVVKAVDFTLTFSKSIKIIALAQFVFLFQFWTEFAVLKNSHLSNNVVLLQEFSLFSVDSFLNSLGINYSMNFKYAFQILNIFEILYSIFLSIILKVVFKISIKRAIVITFLCYILPLLIWLLFISSITFLYN